MCRRRQRRGEACQGAARLGASRPAPILEMPPLLPPAAPGRSPPRVHAPQDLRPGQEVTLRYSPVPLSNRDLLRGYGFTLQGNPHDRVSLALPAAGSSSSTMCSGGGGCSGSGDGGPAAGPSLSAPHLLAALGLPPALLDPGGGLDLEAACPSSNSSSTAAERRLLAAVGSLQPFLRAAPSGSGSSTPAHLPEQERQHERAAAEALAAQCWAQLRALPTSLGQDEMLLGSGGGQAPPLSPRVRAAVAYRAERKRLLRAMAAALRRYCAWLDSCPRLLLV